jgi:hypothetical protein
MLRHHHAAGAAGSTENARPEFQALNRSLLADPAPSASAAVDVPLDPLIGVGFTTCAAVLSCLTAQAILTARGGTRVFAPYRSRAVPEAVLATSAIPERKR